MLESGLEKIDIEVQTSLSSLGNSSRTQEDLEQELTRLREDKSLLEGKIRGYLTLGKYSNIQHWKFLICIMRLLMTLCVKPFVNIRQRENVGNQHFLYFPSCFPQDEGKLHKLSFEIVYKIAFSSERVKFCCDVKTSYRLF